MMTYRLQILCAIHDSAFQRSVRFFGSNYSPRLFSDFRARKRREAVARRVYKLIRSASISVRDTNSNRRPTFVSVQSRREFRLVREKKEGRYLVRGGALATRVQREN